MNEQRRQAESEQVSGGLILNEDQKVCTANFLRLLGLDTNEGHMELSIIRRTGKRESRFYEEVEKVNWWRYKTLNREGHAGIYFGVCPRRDKPGSGAGGVGTKADVLEVPALGRAWMPRVTRSEPPSCARCGMRGR